MMMKTIKRVVDCARRLRVDLSLFFSIHWDLLTVAVDCCQCRRRLYTPPLHFLKPNENDSTYCPECYGRLMDEVTPP